MAWALVKDHQEICFVVEVKLEAPIPKVESSDSSFYVPDPGAWEKVDHSVDAASAEVKNSPYEGETETFCNVIDIAVRDTDDIIFKVAWESGAIRGPTFVHDER